MIIEEEIKKKKIEVEHSNMRWRVRLCLSLLFHNFSNFLYMYANASKSKLLGLIKLEPYDSGHIGNQPSDNSRPRRINFLQLAF